LSDQTSQKLTAMIENSSELSMRPRMQWPVELLQAGELLAKAFHFAEAQYHSPWDFAVELCELQQIGLSRCDLRNLVAQGFLDHAEELPTTPSGERRFRPTGRLTFADRTCFVLTKLGRLAIADTDPTRFSNEEKARQPTQHHPASISNSDNNGPSNLRVKAIKPIWDPGLLRLSFGDLLVKQFRTHALNQHLILSAFQEEDWRDRIDDPLPPVDQIEPKRRLHDTIAGLNRHQINHVLHFFGVGSGRGVGWVPKQNASPSTLHLRR
jgi:hypothetical protein